MPYEADEEDVDLESGLDRGKKYRIVHLNDSDKTQRESVMIFLEARREKGEIIYVFTVRRAVGAAKEMPKRWCRQVWETDQTTACFYNRRYVGETRVL